MSIVVQKYGGSSVADAAGISNVARRIVETFDGGRLVCAVVSACGDTTDDLLRLAAEVSPHPPRRELDMLLSAGERISCALVAMAVERLRRPAVSFTGSQAGIVTDTGHGEAQIVEVRANRVEMALEQGKIALVAGFQGVSTENEVTTLGRGGSDTSAVALAHALGAELCEIYTDVDGVYSANPSVVASARLMTDVTLDEMIGLTAAGAEVLALRSVLLARRHQMPLRVRSSFTTTEGTLVRAGAMNAPNRICGVAFTTDESVLTITGLEDRAAESRILEAIAQTGVAVDYLVRESNGDISLVLAEGASTRAAAALSGLRSEQVCAYSVDKSTSRVSVVGRAAEAAETGAAVASVLRRHGVAARLIQTSLSQSCLVPKDLAEDVVADLHDALGLGSD